MELKEMDLESSEILVQEVQYWEWERNTWNLIQKLFSLRYMAPPEGGAKTHAYSSIVSKLVARTQLSSRFQEALLVKDWLEDVVDDFTAVEVRRGYLPYTTRLLDQGIKTDTLVSHLDPDAPTRTHKTWESNDQDYENQLMITLFNYIRRGMMTEAVHLCKLVDEPWRAASLLGGLLKSDGIMDSDETWTGSETFSGNSNRALWKAVCRKISKDETTNPHERALYAVLSGEWKQAMEVCNSWEDELWNMYSAHVEELTEAGLDGVEKETLSPTTIFEELERSLNKNVRQSCNSPFHIIQRMIVLNRVDQLISNVCQELERARQRPDTVCIFRHPHVLRFMVHLVLLLRPLTQVSEQDGNYIIKCYVDTLVDCKKSAIVAPYAAILPVGDRTDSYSSLLSSMNPNAKIKKDYLSKARTYGMDTSSIAWQAVEKAFNRGIRLEPLVDPKLVRLDWNSTVSPSDSAQIHSLEWLTMVPEQLDSALFAANFLLRRFMRTFFSLGLD
jgi:nuclear pore complex protein Nup107